MVCSCVCSCVFLRVPACSCVFLCVLVCSCVFLCVPVCSCVHGERKETRRCSGVLFFLWLSHRTPVSPTGSRLCQGCSSTSLPWSGPIPRTNQLAAGSLATGPERSASGDAQQAWEWLLPQASPTQSASLGRLAWGKQRERVSGRESGQVWGPGLGLRPVCGWAWQASQRPAEVGGRRQESRAGQQPEQQARRPLEERAGQLRVGQVEEPQREERGQHAEWEQRGWGSQGRVSGRMALARGQERAPAHRRARLGRLARPGRRAWVPTRRGERPWQSFQWSGPSPGFRKSRGGRTERVASYTEDGPLSSSSRRRRRQPLK